MMKVALLSLGLTLLCMLLAEAQPRAERVDKNKVTSMVLGRGRQHSPASDCSCYRAQLKAGIPAFPLGAGLNGSVQGP